MRKLLLAGVAVIGSAGMAAAQTAPAPMPMGVMGMPAAPTTYLGGNNAINQDGGPMSAPAASIPTPGSMVVHLNARVWAYATISGSSNNVTANGKLAPEQLNGYFRIYPGVDAMATNGLRYGAIVEIRQNFLGQSYGLNSSAGTPLSGNGAGANYSSSTSGASSGSTLYVRREAVYLGSNQIGIFRIGQDDGPFSQFDNGVTTFQLGTGLWNGDIDGTIASAAQPTAFPFWSGVGAEYAASKIAYYSPRFAGFDFGASFAPNNAPNQDGGCAGGGPGCANTSSASTNAFGGEARQTNWYEIMGRYQGNFAGLGIYGIAGYSGSGHVQAPGVQYDGFSVGDAGLVLSYAGFSFGGNVLWGAYNGEVALKAQGAVDANVWVLGASYVNGPIAVGGAYWNMQSSGAYTSTPGFNGSTQKYDDALGLSAVYGLAPGLNLYAEYVYSQSYQGGVTNVHGQAFGVGARVQW